MVTYKLSPYWVQMRRTRDKGNWWKLDDLISEHSEFRQENVLDEIETFLSKYMNYTEVDKESEKTFTVDEYTRNGQTIEGVFVGGRYGRGHDYYNINDEERIENAQDPDDAVETPYYFMFYLPEENKERLLFMLEFVGVGGVKGMFDSEFGNFFEDISDKIILKNKPITHPNLIEKIESADKLIELELSKKEKSSQLHDRVGDIFNDTNQSAKETIQISADSNSTLPIDMDTFTDVFGNEEVTSYTIDDVEYDTAKLSISINDSTRKLSLFSEEVKTERIVEPEDDDVDLDPQQNPVPSSLSPVAREYANEILEREGYGQMDGDTIL